MRMQGDDNARKHLYASAASPRSLHALCRVLPGRGSQRPGSSACCVQNEIMPGVVERDLAKDGHQTNAAAAGQTRKVVAKAWKFAES